MSEEVYRRCHYEHAIGLLESAVRDTTGDERNAIEVVREYVGGLFTELCKAKTEAWEAAREEKYDEPIWFYKYESLSDWEKAREGGK